MKIENSHHNSMNAPLQSLPINDLLIGNDLPLSFIAGPCIMESYEHLFHVAQFLDGLRHKLDIPFIFKCSYDKANRTSHQSYRGFGIDKGLQMLSDIKKEFHFPILTDVHTERDIEKAADVVDILQIPAFLSRQTDLIIECAKTNKVVNIKKGQFLSPHDIQYIVEKVLYTGNKKIMVTERGTSFGYQDLIVDMRSIEILRNLNVPVVFDATHSVQKPSALHGRSGGDRSFAHVLAKAAVSLSISSVFMEVHPNPDMALSDGANSLQLSVLDDLWQILIKIDRLVKKG